MAIAKLIGLGKQVADWIARRDNPHNVTATQLNTYAKSELNESMLKQRVFPADQMPFTRYGNQMWLPINVSGSFEGATRNEAVTWNALHVEDDGTLIALVNATNGVKEGVYFSEFTVSAEGELLNHVPIATEYRPSFLRTEEWITAVLQSSCRTAVWGHIANNPDYDSFFCLTGGSLNPNGHVGARFKKPAGIGRNLGTAFVSGVYAYIMWPGNDWCSIDVWRCHVVDIQTKAFVTFTKVTGIVTEGVRGKQYTDDTIRVAKVEKSTNLTYEPLFHVNGRSPTLGEAQCAIWGDVDVSNGDIWMRHVHPGQQNTNSNWYGISLAYTVIYNPTTNRARIAESQKGGFVTKETTGGVGWETFLSDGTPLSFNRMTIDAPRQFHDSVCIGSDGLGFKICYTNQGTGSIFPFRMPSGIPVYKLWDFVNYVSVSLTRKLLARTYPSSFGDSAKYIHLLSPNVIAATSTSNVKNNIWSTRTTITTTQIGAPDFNYPIARVGNIPGFKPQARVDRTNSFRPGHCQYSNNSGGFHIGMGLLWDGKLSDFTKVTSDLVYSGKVETTTALWNDLRERVHALDTNPETMKLKYDSRMELRVFDDAGINPLVIMHIRYTDGSNVGRRIMASVKVNAREGMITSIDIVKRIYTDTMNDVRGFINHSAWDLPPSMVHSYADEKFKLIFISTFYGFSRPGDSPSLAMALMKLDADSDYRTDWMKTYNSNPWYQGFYQAIYIPVIGLCWLDTNLGGLMSGTGLAYRYIGKTKTEIEAWDPTTPYIAISQMAPIGWFVYITEEVPCLLNGKMKNIPATTIDLTKIQSDPANKKYYIYVVDNGNGAEYETRIDPQPETMTRCFIGEIETGTIQVTHSEVRKVTRIGTFRISSTQVGSAIPTVDGLPTSPNVLTWTKTS